MAYGSNSYKGKYKPVNPQKYKGDINNIVARSSWERKFMVWADNTPNVVEWQSEETVVPYISPVDGKYHRYFLDFKVKIKDNKGILTTYLIEIKPKSMCNPPAPGKRKTKSYVEEVCRWGVNKAKWDAAHEHSLDRGWKFIILTEENLGIK
jgi:hypothetical protein